MATSGINGWFYVGNYGVPWYDIQPVIASHPVTSMFLTLSILTGLLAAWYLPDGPPGTPKSKTTGATASWPLRHCWWSR